MMNDKYRNKYRIASNRMPGWDYSGNGYYFITLVTQNRICNLGKIVKTHGRASVVLSDFGKIIDTEWNKSFEIRNELYCDQYIVMPNHLHAIIILKKPANDNMGGSHESHNTRDTHDTHDTRDTYDTRVETHGRASLRPPHHSSGRPPEQSPKQPPEQSQKLPFTRKPKSISSFVGGFKSAINSKIDDCIDENKLNIAKFNRNNHFFQPNYHDRIVRDFAEYQRIKKYIIDNPIKWNNDNFNPGNAEKD